MKKIALFLSIIMLFGACVALNSCTDNSSAAASVEDNISDEVKYALMSKMALQNVTSGASLTYHNHTIKIKETGKNTYSVSGTATAISKGTKYTASYSGEVEYNPSTSDYDVDINVGKFR